ncbi:MAG: DUF192 domain-containing protein [Patescibacteria group bacterium]|nr:DUF192 domain-containing protein [Patescibacteria group bacterium]
MPKQMQWLPIFIFIVAVGISIWWWRGKHAPANVAMLAMGSHQIFVEVADTIPLRAQGLSGRDGLQDGHGMLFVYKDAGNYPFWMKDMKFPLDFVWIRENKVVGVTDNVPIPKGSILSLPVYYPPENIDAMLEIRAGVAAELGIRTGDMVELKK